jgi:TRAP-type mannitol/chloroaromatic compound transport system permease small subunit
MSDRTLALIFICALWVAWALGANAIVQRFYRTYESDSPDRRMLYRFIVRAIFLAPFLAIGLYMSWR